MGEGLHGDTPTSFGAPEPNPPPRPVRGFDAWERFFSPQEGPYHGVDRGRTRDARITKYDGTVVFALDGVEAPEAWSDEAVNIAAQKYFVRNETVTERSVFEMIHGVVSTIGEAGARQGYFATREAQADFCADLAYLLIHQMGAFNSPVWFNVRRWHVYGIPGGPGNWAWGAERGEVGQVARGYERPQCSACQPYHALVNTEEGLVPIGDLVTHNRVGLRVQDGDGLTPIQAVKSNGIKKVYRVRLADGFQVEATGDHLVCAHPVRRTVREEWRRVDDLRPGMFMRVYARDGAATPRTSPEQAVAEAALAGWLQCDGFVGQYDEGTNTALTVETLSVNADEYAWVCGLQATVFPDVQWNETREDVSDPALDFRRRRAYGERFRTFVEGYDLLTRNPSMRVPPRIFQSADDVVVAYLRSLFQADGYVSLRDNGAIIGLSKCSRELIQGVQLLLARLGIYSRVNIKEEKRADRYDQWCLSIATLSERQRFAEKIGFVGATKQSKLDASLDMDGKDSSRVRYVPIEAIEVVAEQPVYDIQTASGKYLSGSVLVHNCFIQRIDDSLVEDGGIADFVKSEMRLFKYGSGSGANFSTLREKDARLTPGGKASGLMSFLPVFDRAAGSVASGGTSRRAAKMVILDVDHPEIFEFIRWKMIEEKKAQALIAAGFSGGMEGEAYSTVSGQNANNSVRVTDAFMRAVEADADVALTSRIDGRVLRTVKARDIWNAIADAAWHCADPGVQFHDTINDWHTTPNAGPIRGSNPCCFTGDTLVDTAEGRISFAALEAMSRAGEPLPHVFAFDTETRLPRLVPATRAWVAGETRELVEVRTERGLVLRCTPEHRFLTHAGEYVPASDLQAGVRLRKVARGENEARASRRSIHHRVTDSAPNGCQYQARWMWEQVYGPVPEGFEVHHKNHDPTDDRLSNFELLPITDHRVEHSTAENNPRYLDVDTAKLLDVWESVAASDNGRSARVGTVTVARWNRYIVDHGLKGKVPLARGDGRIRGMSWDAFSTQMRQAQSDVNDRVVSVTRITLDHPVQVYDLESPETHNFAVTDATSQALHTIVVHNSEYMHLDDSACNLASLNLVKFLKDDGTFDYTRFTRACYTFAVAQDILVDLSSYPTKAIAEGAHRYRQLGLGYANLGTLLMLMGLPYDSDRGRQEAARITSCMTASGYLASVDLAAVLGPFEGFGADVEGMLRVLGKHAGEHERALGSASPIWTTVCAKAARYGVRNAQMTVLAPTGTIGFLMDCKTTGVEPSFAHLQYKQLAGGGNLVLVNGAVSTALRRLGYTEAQVAAIAAHVEATGGVSGSRDILPEHVAVFDTAMPSGTEQRCLSVDGHILMMAAVQPFLSGAISKTVNLPADTTVEGVADAYMKAWKLKLKAVALYRDGCKSSQPVTTKKVDAEAPKNYGPALVREREPGAPLEEFSAPLGAVPSVPDDLLKALAGAAGKSAASEPAFKRGQRKLPKERRGTTWDVKLDGHKLFVRTGEYPDGSLGEVFVDIAQEGSTLAGLLGSWARMVSVGLQYGVPLEEVVQSFTFTRFEPWGRVTDHATIRTATSLIDLVMRILAVKYLGRTDLQHVQPENLESAHLVTIDAPAEVVDRRVEAPAVPNAGPPCPTCGVLTRRTGTCHACPQCGTSLGCS